MPEITRGPKSGQLEQKKRRARVYRNADPNGSPDGPALGGDSTMDRRPRRWKEPDMDLVQEIRNFKEIKKNDGGNLVGATGLLGQRHWDEKLYKRIQDMKDAELERRQQNMLEQIVYDPSDPYQRSKLDAMMPSFKSSRDQVADEQIAQFAFLTKMGMKGEFSDAEEANRILMILGGAEKLICLNHVFAATAGSTDDRRRGGLGGMFAAGDRFPKTYQDDEWQTLAGQNSTVRILLRQLAKSVLHLFPVLLAGKLQPYSAKAGRGPAAAADALQEYAVQYCKDISGGQYLKDAIENITEGSPVGLTGYLPSKIA